MVMKSGVFTVHDDKLLFEFLLLESFQAGLILAHSAKNSGITLGKPFPEFEVEKVANYGEGQGHKTVR